MFHHLLTAVIPLLVADTGGGNALNVQRFVRELIDAGAAGCFLEVRGLSCMIIIDLFSSMFISESVLKKLFIFTVS